MSSKKTKRRLSALDDALSGADIEAGEDRKPARRSTLLARTNTLRQIAEGKQQSVQRLKHPTSRIRIWAGHNRRYDLLSPDRCSDLIDGFKRTGKQEIPAFVRKVTDDPNIDYEVICGARRHWTASHLGWDLLIEVLELDDRQAWILQDIENRDREDVSDYERAIDFKRGLADYFEGNKSQMANTLDIDRTNFNKLLELAALPAAIVDAYVDLRDLKVHHGVAYKRLLADRVTKSKVLGRARAVKGQNLPGPKVFAALKSAAKEPAPAPTSTRHGCLTVRTEPGGTARVSVPARDDNETATQYAARLKSDLEDWVDAWVKE